MGPMGLIPQGGPPPQAQPSASPSADQGPAPQPGMMGQPPGLNPAPDAASPSPADNGAGDQMAKMIMGRFASLKPDDKAEVQKYMTPEAAQIFGLLFGPEVGKLIDGIADKNSMLLPVQRDAVMHMGMDKMNNFLSKAQEKAMAAKNGGGIMAGAAEAPQVTPQHTPAVTPLPRPATSVGALPLK